MMRIFAFLFLVFGLSACSLETIKKLNEIESEKDYVHNPYFSNTSKDYVYKAKIKALKNKFGGIVIIKKVGEEKHRIVFTTEFGNKIFDFELEKGVFKTNYIVDALNKKLIIKPLQNDFKTLIQTEKIVIKAFSNPTKELYQCQDGKNYNFYSFQADILTQIIQTNKNKEKCLFFFENIEESQAKKIQIQHQNIGLEINLWAF